MGKIDSKHQYDVAQVTLNMFGNMGQVAKTYRVIGDCGFVPLVEGEGGRIEMAGAADPADTRGDDQTIKQTTAAHHLFKATEHGAGNLRLDHLMIGEINADLQVTFHAIDRQG